MNTEITDNGAKIFRGWVLFDGDCPLCTASARFFGRTLNRHGFTLATLQTAWVRVRLGLREGVPPSEMRLLLANGDAPGGAEAIIEIARRIWWGWPLFLFAKLPGVKPLFRAVYRHIATNRYCGNGVCNVRKRVRWSDCLPLILLPAGIVALRNEMAPWIYMWTLAGAIFAGCKWLTFRRAFARQARPGPWRSLAYFFAWPGMNATEFLLNKNPAGKVSKRQWLFAGVKTLAGFTLTFLAAHGAFGARPLLTGWIAMVGIILFLHFGLFAFLALGWQAAGINAKPIMRQPLFATSLADFWGARWNTAFNNLAHDFVSRPLSRKIGIGRTILAAFLISGIVHDLVISVPAQGGFGLPTAYFIFQGLAVLAERSCAGHRIGLGKGFRGWLFTMTCAAGPAFWLFHPPFVMKVILPMLKAIGTN